MIYAHLEQLERWWTTVPATQRHALYRPQTIAAATGIPNQALPLVAALAGWQRATRWHVGPDGRRKLRTYYAPPGHRVPDAAPRGRPSTTVYTILNRRPPSPFDEAA